MRTRRTCLLLFVGALAFAQEGHPLTGTWHGSWGPNATQRTDVTFIMDWDGKTVTGIINPGFDGMKLQNVRLEPKGWAVHFEADAKDGRVVVDGKIENITNVRRSITGTWMQGTRRGDFKIIRDN